ncbi:MAG TPA: Rv3235 family protein [Ornithinimicrobium sp.]|nr:Rv3235 family protein [Ornithinimicrobium sp.]
MTPVRPTAGHATITRLVPQQRTTFGRAEVQGTLALDLAALETPPPPPETPELDHDRRARSDHQADMRLRDWTARLAQAAVETAAGQRPVSQLVRWTTPEVYADLERRAHAVSAVGAPRSRRTRPQVRSLHLCRPSEGALEVSVHVRHGERSRAVALRLERRSDRWVCVALQFG